MTTSDPQFEIASRSWGVRRRWELVLVVLAVAGQIAVWWAVGLPYRAHNQDELHTYILTTDPDLEHSLEALKNGVDANPAGLFLMLRGVRLIPGLSSEWTARCFSMASVALALMLMYVALRYDVSPLAAGIGVLCIWNQPFLMHQASEGRFYGSWCAVVAATCVVMRHTKERGVVSPLAFASLMGLAALAGSIHYFAIVSTGLLVFGYAWSARHVHRAWFAAIATLALGLLTVVWFSGYLRGQSSFFTTPTYMASATVVRVLIFLGLLGLVPICSVAIMGLLGRMFPSLTCASPDAFVPRARSVWESQLPCVSLLAMPAVIVVFSYVVQPALAPRYVIPSLLAAGPVAAGLAVRINPLTGRYVALTLYVLATAGLIVFGARERETRSELARKIAVLESLPGDEPVVVESKYTFMQMFHYAPRIRDRLRILDFEEGEIDLNCQGLGALCDPNLVPTHERDVMRQITKYYPRFKKIPYDELENLSQFYLIRWSTADAASRDYPQFDFAPIDSEGIVILRATRRGTRRDRDPP